jgi:hypothetical protein
MLVKRAPKYDIQNAAESTDASNTDTRPGDRARARGKDAAIARAYLVKMLGACLSHSPRMKSWRCVPTPSAAAVIATAGVDIVKSAVEEGRWQSRAQFLHPIFAQSLVVLVAEERA